MPLITAILISLPMVQVGHILALTDMVLHTHIIQLTATMQVRTQKYFLCVCMALHDMFFASSLLASLLESANFIKI